jgi:hypothetical protein
VASTWDYRRDGVPITVDTGLPPGATGFAALPNADENGLPRPFLIQDADGKPIYIDPDTLAEAERREQYWRPRPADVPDWRQWLVDNWAPSGTLRAIAPLLDAASSGQRFVPPWEWHQASEAALWFVADEMCDLLAGAAEKFEPPGPLLTAELVPDRAGLVIFQTPLAGIDATGSGLNCRTGAFLWGPAVWEATGDEVIGITVYGLGHGHRMPLSPLGSLVWPYGRRADDPLNDLADTWTDLHPDEPRQISDERASSMAEDRRRLAALWLLSSQPGLTQPSEPRAPSRAVARRAARAANPLDPRVRIIQLRQRPPRDRDAPAPGTRTHVHRWLVDAYWRRPPNQPDADKTVYVNGSLRGPSGAPLLAPAEKVKVWKR